MMPTPNPYYPVGVGVSRERYEEFLKQKYDLTQRMCVKLANFLGAFGHQSEADELTMALSSLLNLETVQEIDILQNDPGPRIDAEFCPPPFDLTGQTEQLAQCVEKAERLKEQLGKIRAGLDHTPLELKANIEAAIAYFENEQRNAEQQRDWIQKQIEAHQPKRANAE